MFPHATLQLCVFSVSLLLTTTLKQYEQNAVKTTTTHA
jgi:hypothetical protein